MEKIIVNPLSVRGLGDIVSPKILADFDVCDGVLATSTDTVNGVSMTVFTTSYRSGSRLLKSGDGFIVYTPDLTSMSVSVLLKTKSGSVISSASVSCIIDNETTLTATTNSSGKANFTIPFVEGESYYSLRFVYAGTGSVAGCSIYGQIFVGTPTDLTLSGVKDIVAVDETSRLTATLTGVDVSDEPMGIPFVTVDIYACREYHRLLDAVTVSCESTGDNYCYSIGLDDLDFDLSGDFSLEFDYRNTVNGGRLCIGDSSSWSAGARAGDNYLYMGTSTAGNGGYGTKHNTTTNNSSTGAVAAGTTLHYKIMRHGNTIAYYLNDVLKGTKTAEWVSDVTDWSIYLQCWGTGDYTVKNVCLDLEPDVGDSPILTINAVPTTVSLGESVTISGNFDPNNEVSQLDDWVIQIYEGTTQVTTALTDSNGDYSVSITPSVVGSHVYHAYRASSAEFDEVSSSNVSVTVSKITSTISLSAASASVTVGNNVSLSGTLSVGSGESVKIYQGDTLIDTVTTTTDGAFTKSVTGLGVGSYTFKAVFEGDSTYASSTSGNVSVTVNKITSTISLSVASASVVYGNNVALSGTLSVGSGESVKIYQGDTLIDTVTTGTGGAFSKSVSGLSAGSYTFKATYEGDTTHTNVTSSTVSATVTKATPTISLSSSSATVTVNTIFTLSGTLSIGAGKSVKIYDGSTLLDTVTSGTGGAFSKSLSVATAGSKTYKATYEGDSNYNSVTSSGVSVTIQGVTPSFDGITVSSTKDILSYADGDSATISAQLMDGQSAASVSGQTVVFKKGSSTVATETTDSGGVASYTYSATGAGDVGFTVECMNLQETYSIEDCIIANVNASYTGTSTNDTVYSIGYDQIADLSSTNFEMTWKFRQTNYGCDVCLGASSEFSVSPIKSNYRVYIGNSGNGYTRHGYRTTSTTNTGGSTSGEVSLNTDHTMKIVREGNTFSYYFNDVLMGTKTVSFWANYSMFGIHTVQWNKGTTTISNLKLKPL